MNFDEFTALVKDDIGIRPSKIQGISNIARIMNGCVFMGGPNLEGFEGGSYAFTSKISFSPISHLFFCVHFNSSSPKLHEAVQKLDRSRINNCKLVLDDLGLFISTNSDINQGEYSFSSESDIRVQADTFIYHLTETSISIDGTIEWITSRIKGSIKNLSVTSANSTTISEELSFDPNLFAQNALEADFIIDKKTALRFIASLITKPFVILTGLSGSGKTKLAQAFASWICEKDSQYCIIPVGADWTNREPLLGFPNALQANEYVKPDNRALDLIIEANKNLAKPYFLILDEMNLSHVERYFADFLSVMESKNRISLHSGTEKWGDVEGEISFPPNLFIIGTVNIDETTYMFSPKVLDRANVIEFRVTAEEMASYINNKVSVNLNILKGNGAKMADSFVKIAIGDYFEIKNSTDLSNALMVFFNELRNTGAEFGFRSASEILRFAAVVNVLDESWSISDIIDAAIMQKLLPKIHGSRKKLEPAIKTLGKLCLQDGQELEEFITTTKEIDYSDTSKIKYPISLEKILRMYNNLVTNGFTSYAEA